MLVLSVAVFGLYFTSAIAHGQIYNETDGYVLMEAENTLSPLGNWIYIQPDEKHYVNGASGTGQLEFGGNNTSSGPADSPLEFRFKINTRGSYVLVLRGFKRLDDPNNPGEELESDKANDAYIRLKGNFESGNSDVATWVLENDAKMYGGGNPWWGWARNLDTAGAHHKHPIYNFEAGEIYTLTVSGRSQQFSIDRIIFYNLDTYTFDDAKTITTETVTITDPRQTLYATSDFTNLSSGEVPYYVDSRRGALAINAAQYQDKFARAETTFNGDSGSYDLTLNSMRELDGECVYRFYVDGQLIGEVTNHTTSTDYAIQEHVFFNLPLSNGSVIAVESNTASNGLIPEGNAYAFARGRWTSVVVEPASGGENPQPGIPQPGNFDTVQGELKKWHKTTLMFEGPETWENNAVNPFMDYRLDVTFSHAASGKSYVVPGYYAADGNAAESSANSGNKWMAHFAPDEEGEWRYTASFRTGSQIAISDAAGTSAGYFDGATDTFTIAPSDKTGNDNRAKGLLRYVGKHHLQFAETGEYFLKGGADSPENFLGYWEFDGTYDNGGGVTTPGLINNLHRFTPHVQHWNEGDPIWKSNKGKGIIGVVNYLASQGMNSIYFLTFNSPLGDGRDTWPWIADNQRLRYDCSKLAQWEIVFEHMNNNGIQLHVVTAETENDVEVFDNRNANFAAAVERKLYYRELVARFSHHLNVIWNLGEENDNTDNQLKEYAAYIQELDPYDHPITVHTKYGKPLNLYDGLVGDPGISATSIQGHSSEYNAWAIQFRNESAAAGRPWAIYGDEQFPHYFLNIKNIHTVRKNALWGNLMGGGAGVEWYFGYNGIFGDVQSEDLSVVPYLWEVTDIALDFFQAYLPFQDMTPDNGLVTKSDAYCLYLAGTSYAVYLKNGGTTELDLKGVSGELDVSWFDPRNGGALQSGDVTAVQGGSLVSLGNPPSEADQDWVILLTGEDNNTIPSIRTQNLDAGRQNERYTAIVQASQGELPLSWTITSGSLPDGMTFSNGLISGTPTVHGYYSFTLKVTDANGDSDTQNLSILLGPDPISSPTTSFTAAEGYTAGNLNNQTDWSSAAGYSVDPTAPGRILLDNGHSNYYNAVYQQPMPAEEDTYTVGIKFTYDITDQLPTASRQVIALRIHDEPGLSDGFIRLSLQRESNGSSYKLYVWETTGDNRSFFSTKTFEEHHMGFDGGGDTQSDQLWLQLKLNRSYDRTQWTINATLKNLSDNTQVTTALFGPFDTNEEYYEGNPLYAAISSGQETTISQTINKTIYGFMAEPQIIERLSYRD